MFMQNEDIFLQFACHTFCFYSKKSINYGCNNRFNGDYINGERWLFSCTVFILLSNKRRNVCILDKNSWTEFFAVIWNGIRIDGQTLRNIWFDSVDRNYFLFFICAIGLSGLNYESFRIESLRWYHIKSYVGLIVPLCTFVFAITAIQSNLDNIDLLIHASIGTFILLRSYRLNWSKLKIPHPHK